MKYKTISKIIDSKYKRYTKNAFKIIQSPQPSYHIVGCYCEDERFCRHTILLKIIDKVSQNFVSENALDGGLSDTLRYYAETGILPSAEAKHDIELICWEIVKSLPEDELRLLWTLTDSFKRDFLDYYSMDRTLSQIARNGPDKDAVVQELYNKILAKADNDELPPGVMRFQEEPYLDHRMVANIIKDKYIRYADEVENALSKMPPECRDGDEDVLYGSLWEQITAEINKYGKFFAEYEESINKVCLHFVESLPKDEIKLLWYRSQVYFEDSSKGAASMNKMTEGVKEELSEMIYYKIFDEA